MTEDFACDKLWGMSIDVEPIDLGPVIQLVAKSGGWKPEETRYILNPSVYISGNPDLSISNQTPNDLIKPLRAAWLTTQDKRPNDFNGLKVGVQRLTVMDDGILQTDGVITDYFTAWGLPKSTDSKDLYAEHERQVVTNRAVELNVVGKVLSNVLRRFGLRNAEAIAIYETKIPWAVCSHNVLLDKNGDLLMMVRSMAQGFNAGRVSVTEEEQMEPAQDYSPFAASYRSFHEELNLIVPPQSLRLLGVALEKGAAYPAFAFVAEANKVASNIVDQWRKARDYNENTALFAVGMTEVDRWLESEEITPDVWHKDLLAGNISPDAKLKFHATSPWRIGLIRKYIAST